MGESNHSSYKNAVIYARYFSERQNDQSIDGQIRIINQFAEKEGYIIIDTYIDGALTGRNDDRPSFQKMIVDSSNKAFQYVIVYKLDRFSRNRYDSTVYKKKLKENGVTVISATENITDTPEGVIMESIIEGIIPRSLRRKSSEGITSPGAKGNTLALRSSMVTGLTKARSTSPTRKRPKSSGRFSPTPQTTGKSRTSCPI